MGHRSPPSTTNYWVDLVFSATDAAPTVASTQPGDGSTNVNVADPISVTLAGFVQDGTARLDVARNGTAVTGATSYSSATRTLTFQPSSPLRGGRDLHGHGQRRHRPVGQRHVAVHVAVHHGERHVLSLHALLELGRPGPLDCRRPRRGGARASGSRPTPTARSPGCASTRARSTPASTPGTLWSSSGAVLATGTFTGESASGWQTLVFSSAVAVSAGTTYVVSYHAPNGHYSATSGFFANVVQPTGRCPRPERQRQVSRTDQAGSFPREAYGATNYWVDPIFRTGTPPDTTAPDGVDGRAHRRIDEPADRQHADGRPSARTSCPRRSASR